MSQPEKYDLVVLGSGEGGMFIAWSLGSQGKRSAGPTCTARVSKRFLCAEPLAYARRCTNVHFGAMVHAKKIPMEERSQ